MTISIRAVEKQFGRYPALNKVGLEIADGELLALLGPSGSGKSYTMMGDIDESPQEFGLVPRICYGLFEMLDQNAQGPNNSDEVFFSQMEIYNETVKDLLVDPQTYVNAKFNGNTSLGGGLRCKARVPLQQTQHRHCGAPADKEV